MHAANVEELKSRYEKDPEAFKAEFKKDYIESAKKQYKIADQARKDALIAKNNNSGAGTKPTYAQRLKFENFVTSFNSGEDIIGENNIFVRNNKGGYEVYTKGRQPVLNPPTTGKDGVAIKGSQQTITLEDLISRATDLGLPQEYVDLLKEKTRKSQPDPMVGNFKKGGLPD